MDEAQLNVALNQRGVIYKKQTVKEQPQTKEIEKVKIINKNFNGRN